jgi:hypothetical protein
MLRRLVVLGVVLLLPRVSSASTTCFGDCNENGTVNVDEIVKGVRIGLDLDPFEQCPEMDGNGNGVVAVNEIITAVNNGLDACPAEFGTFFGTVDLNGGQSATMDMTVAVNGAAVGDVEIQAGSGLAAALAAPGGGGAGIGLLQSFTLSGSVNLETGAYTLNGSFVDENQQTVAVQASGILPIATGASGTFNFRLGPETFAGSIVEGGGSPTPTRSTTSPTQTPTPTVGEPTPTSGIPTPAPGCGGAYAQVDISAKSADANLEESATSYELTKGGGNLVLFNQAIFGTNVAKCPVEDFGVARVIEVAFYAAGPDIAPGQTYPLNEGTPGALVPNSFLYREGTAAPSLKTWMAESGTVTIDAVDGNRVSLHLTARMVPGGVFPFGPPAMGSFTVNATVTAEVMITRP